MMLTPSAEKRMTFYFKVQFVQKIILMYINYQDNIMIKLPISSLAAFRIDVTSSINVTSSGFDISYINRKISFELLHYTNSMKTIFETDNILQINLKIRTY